MSISLSSFPLGSPLLVFTLHLNPYHCMPRRKPDDDLVSSNNFHCLCHAGLYSTLRGSWADYAGRWSLGVLGFIGFGDYVLRQLLTQVSRSVRMLWGSDREILEVVPIQSRILTPRNSFQKRPSQCSGSPGTDFFKTPQTDSKGLGDEGFRASGGFVLLMLVTVMFGR